METWCEGWQAEEVTRGAWKWLMQVAGYPCSWDPESSSLKILKTCLDMALSNLLYLPLL